MRRALLLFAAILVPQCVRAQMAEPFAVELALPGNTYRGALDPDGRTFRFFRKVTQGAEDYRIHESVLEGGRWSAPREISFSSTHSDLYPTTSPDGRLLVFASYRPVPGDTSSHPNANMWTAERLTDGWSEPRPLAGAATYARYDSAPLVLADGRVVYTSTSADWRQQETRVVVAGRASVIDSIFDRLRAQPEVSVHACTRTPDGDLAVCDATTQLAGESNVDLWWSRFDGRAWSPLRRIGGDVNTPGVENFALFTPDGRDLLFVRDFSGWFRVSADQLR